MVDDEFLSAAEKGSDISNWIARTFNRLFESKVEQNLRLIEEEKAKKNAPDVNSQTGAPGEEQYPPGLGGPSNAPDVPGTASSKFKFIYELARKAGDPFPEVTAAQSIQEAGYNLSKQHTGAFNVFGQTGRHPTLGGVTLGTPRDPGGGSKTFMNFASYEEAARFRVRRWVPEYGNATTPYEALMNIQKHGGRGRYAQGFPTRAFPQGDWMAYVTNVSRIIKSNGMDPYRKKIPGQAPPLTPGSAGSGGSFVGGGTGAGYGSGGAKIAGDLGDYMKANRGKIGVTGSIHQHPRHPGQFTRNYFSYHNQGRALDIGGYGPNHPSSGGRDEQAPVIRALLAWNKQNGYTPIEIIHGSPAFRGLGKYESAPKALHSNHVHVAYEEGGRVRKLTRAILGEKGPEFVLDADTTAGLDRLAPQLLERLNMAKSKPQLSSILQSYTDYEQSYAEPEIIEVPVSVPVPMGGGYQSGGGMMIMNRGGGDDPFEILRAVG